MLTGVMRKFPAFRAVNALFLGVLLPLTACDAPDAANAPSQPELALVTTPQLLSCPSSETRGVNGRVLPLGGTVALAKTAVVVPASALLGATDITIEVPASEHMLVELKANGQEHWQFLAPVTVTIDYGRCPIGLLDGPVTVWHVDPSSGALLEHMGGIDNRVAKTITFVTDHFSGYAIAN